MGFACAGRAEAEAIGPLFDPRFASGERLHLVIYRRALLH